ncbi:MAG: DUF4175 domain-containing protein [Chloroflexi bacterium]|nr:DUF4175 domain-containing protein [Chloroflexota bacterium]MCL5274221.1 DUF4175 domain-containing protein [Chloroflexota bacterium]
MDELIPIIRSWSARARLQSSLYWIFPGLAAGLAAALALAIAARIFPILDTSTLATFALILSVGGALIAFIGPWIVTARRTQAHWARRFDHQFRLKERMSTALELREGVVTTNNERMRQRQRTDALLAAGSIKASKLLPLRVSARFMVMALAMALALTVAIALPNPQDIVLANRSQLQQAIQEQLQQLENARQQILQSQTLNDSQKRQLVQALEDAQNALSDPNTGPEKALAAINDAQSKLDSLRDQSFQNQSDDLQRAGQSLAPDKLTNPLANALENSQMQQAASALRNLTQNNGKPLDDAQRQQMVNQLEQIAKNVQNSDQATAQQLRYAAQNLRQQNDQAAQAALNKVADTLDKAAQKQISEQQISAAQSSIEEARRAISAAQQKTQVASLPSGQQSAINQSSAQGQQTGGDQLGNAAAQSTIDNTQGQSSAGSGDSQQQGNGQNPALSNNSDSMHSEDTGTDNSVLDPSRINAEGQNVILPDDSGINVSNPNASVNPGVSNQATVPYQQVYAQYAKTADDAIQSGYVPAGLRDYVRDYFSSLDPRQSK